MDKNSTVGETAVVTRAERQPLPLVDVQGNVTYTGYAALGTQDDAPGWLIIRTTVSGSVTRPEYAMGSMAYNQVWNNRASLHYSR